MENESLKLLNGIYKTTAMGLEATKLIIPNIKISPLKHQVAHQNIEYRNMSSKVKTVLENDGRMPKPQDKFKKAMLRGSIKINTMMNTKPEHIAELMVSGTTMGIVDISKKLNHLDGADPKVKKLAEDYLLNEQKNIDELKKHL